MLKLYGLVCKLCTGWSSDPRFTKTWTVQQERLKFSLIKILNVGYFTAKTTSTNFVYAKSKLPQVDCHSNIDVGQEKRYIVLIHEGRSNTQFLHSHCHFRFEVVWSDIISVLLLTFFPFLGVTTVFHQVYELFMLFFRFLQTEQYIKNYLCSLWFLANVQQCLLTSTARV
jgi:hypothetical protein